MSAQLEDAWKEFERTGEICNSAEGLLTHCTAQAEHLRLKEEECKQLQQDKAELVEALQKSQQVMNTFGFIHGNATYSAKEKDKRAQHLMNVHMDKIFTKNSELLEKHKCD